MVKKQKFGILLVTVALLSAGCGIFSKSTTAGVVKTSNGGIDWPFANKLTNVRNGSLAKLNMSELQFDPQNADHVFAGSYSGGLFRSDDAGANWRQILTGIGVYDFAIDPQNHDTIYAGGSFGDHGKVLATKDGGKSWTETFNEEDTLNPVRGIAINPVINNEVVIGLNSGAIIKSVDGGQHWKLMINFADRVNRIRWQNGAVYILLQQKGLYKSGDGGASFQNLSTPLSAPRNFAGVAVSGPAVGNFNRMAVDMGNPSLLWVTTDAGLYKSADEGRTWAHLDLPLKVNNVPVRAVSLSPLSSNTAYVSAGATVYKTVDGGNSWQTQSVNTLGFINTILVHPLLAQIAYAGIFFSDNQ
jgi:photosystem II stability/assembly factor-like uncharacterized protein